MQQITLDHLAKSFGTDPDDLPETVRNLLSQKDFSYRKYTGPDYEKVILNILRNVLSGEHVVVGENKKPHWESGWAENLKSFIENKYEYDSLIPKFIRPNLPIRLNQNFIQASDPMFELHYYHLFRLWLFHKFLKNMDAIYEFGCGTGFNLVELAKLYPEKKLWGLDWAKSAIQLIQTIAKNYNLNLQGTIFDFFKPDFSFNFKPNSTVLTFCALEQIGGKHEPFLQFLLKNPPDLVINMEPILELYDENNLQDYLAILFHKKRAYLSNYLSHLKGLEKLGQVEIIKVQRLFFGSLYHEGYSYIIWRPKKNGA